MTNTSGLQPAGTAGEFALEPDTSEADVRVVNLVQFEFSDHQGFEKRLRCEHLVNPGSRAIVSICEIANGKPVQGAASLAVHNVTPQGGGILMVRGHIGWDTDIKVRLNVFFA